MAKLEKCPMCGYDMKLVTSKYGGSGDPEGEKEINLCSKCGFVE